MLDSSPSLSSADSQAHVFENDCSNSPPWRDGTGVIIANTLEASLLEHSCEWQQQLASCGYLQYIA